MSFHSEDISKPPKRFDRANIEHRIVIVIFLLQTLELIQLLNMHNM